MAVIAATITYEIDRVLEKLDKGAKIEDIIAELTESSRPARFEGNGYSKEWVEEAKKRGLYVNTDFAESIENLKTCGQVFIDIGACEPDMMKAKYTNQANLYINTVNTEARTLQTIISREIIPRCYEFANRVQGDNLPGPVKERSENFMKVFSELVELEKRLNVDVANESTNVSEACKRRKFIFEVCEKVNENIAYLPKTENWPDLEDFMNLY